MKEATGRLARRGHKYEPGRFGGKPRGHVGRAGTQASEAGFEVIRDRKGSENGYCDFLNKKIAVRPEVSEAQALKTLVHEVGHALVDEENPPKTAAIAEVEVESVAYIVCDALGLDTSDYSFAYVARWSGGETDVIKDTAERAVGCAKQLLEGLELDANNDTEMENAS